MEKQDFLALGAESWCIVEMEECYLPVISLGIRNNS
jgi:hypothetical protein